MKENNIQPVLKNGLCTGCGTCVAVCPREALSMILDRAKGIYLPHIDREKCNGCGICFEVCPGHAVDFKQLNLAVFGREPEDVLLGNYVRCYTGHATDYDIRYHSASGGLVTALLIFALETGLIDGALVTRMSARNPLEPEPFIARTREEIISAARSKYCPVPANIALKEIMRAKEGEKFAVVGLPCHIHGIRKAEALNSGLKARIALHLGLFCGHNDNFMMTQFILKWMDIKEANIQILSYRGEGWPGAMSIKFQNGQRKLVPFSKYSTVHEFNMFTPSRCFLCVDHLNIFADIAFGDLWLRNSVHDDIGTTVAISRDVICENLLQQALVKKRLEFIEMSNNIMIRWRPSLFLLRSAIGAMYLLRISGKKIPSYFTDLPQPRFLDLIVAIFKYTARNIGSQRWLWTIIVLTLPLGQSLWRKARKIGFRLYKKVL